MARRRLAHMVLHPQPWSLGTASSRWMSSRASGRSPGSSAQASLMRGRRDGCASATCGLGC
eukprot:7896572-Pyramimonas_sp.AAC.1